MKSFRVVNHGWSMDGSNFPPGEWLVMPDTMAMSLGEAIQKDKSFPTPPQIEVRDPEGLPVAPEPGQNTNFKRVIVTWAGGIGDSLFLGSALRLWRRMKEHYASRVIVVARAGMAALNDAMEDVVDDVVLQPFGESWASQIREEGGFLYDLDYIFSKPKYLKRPAAVCLAEEMGVPEDGWGDEDDWQPRFFVDEKRWGRRINYLKVRSKGKKRVALHPMGSLPRRNPPVALWGPVIEGLEQMGCEVFLIGSDRDKKLPYYVGDIEMGYDIRGHFSNPLETALWLRDSVDLLIGIDSGPVHLAAWAKVPTLALEGPICDEMAVKWYPMARSLRTGKCQYEPCDAPQTCRLNSQGEVCVAKQDFPPPPCYHEGEGCTCVDSHWCVSMEAFTPEMVLEAAREML